jgi:hypothetical protein
MKVIDLQPYILRRDKALLEKRIIELTGSNDTGVVREIKVCFKKWLLIA